MKYMSSDIIKKATWNEEYIPGWAEKIRWEEYEKLAAVGYQPEQIAMYYDIPKPEFMFYFMLIDSKLKYHYNRGILYHQAKDGMGMLEDADSNATQAQRLDRMRKRQDFINARDNIIYGGI
jgi:hypothetical protein